MTAEPTRFASCATHQRCRATGLSSRCHAHPLAESAARLIRPASTRRAGSAWANVADMSRQGKRLPARQAKTTTSTTTVQVMIRVQREVLGRDVTRPIWYFTRHRGKDSLDFPPVGPDIEREENDADHYLGGIRHDRDLAPCQAAR